jgi:hypothetical protein
LGNAFASPMGFDSPTLGNIDSPEFAWVQHFCSPFPFHLGVGSFPEATDGVEPTFALGFYANSDELGRGLVEVPIRSLFP